jgi:hypothetical protein
MSVVVSEKMEILIGKLVYVLEISDSPVVEAIEWL